MAIPIPNNKYRGFPSNLLAATVYLVMAILTMGGCTKAFGEPNHLADPPLVASVPAAQHTEVLYMLLVSEIALSRQQPELALQNYLKMAEMTHDPAIAEQATQLAINLQAPVEAAISAKLWANTATDNLQAQLIAMTLSIGQSIEEATPYLIRAIDLNPNQADQYLLEIQTRLSDASAKKLTEALNQLAAQRPKNPYVNMAAAQSAALQGDTKNANHLVDIALTLNPNLTSALELKARLIRYVADSDTSALKFLSEKVQAFPENHELRLFYSSALIDSGKTEEAKRQLLTLTKDKPSSGQALVLLSEIYLKENNTSIAIETLKKALDFPETKDAAQFLLGEAEENLGNNQAAIRWYADIQPGSYQIQAIVRAVALLKKQKAYKEAIYLLHSSSPNTLEEQKQLIITEIDLLNMSESSEEAMELANEVLPKLPNDPDILYSHAMTATKLKKWEVAEDDLKKILKQNPNNANALNALGYTLASNKNRLTEALYYLNQALAIAPNNPIFMDNIGWIYYRLGDMQQATTYLKKANKLSEDGDIAAHLGEVLWVNNQKKEAISVWKKAYKKNSDNLLLKDTLKRLNINLKNQSN
jgi:tetratricopeptide (TPR) repeat protein